MTDLSPVPHVLRRGSGTPILMIHGNGVDHRFLLPLDHIFEEGQWERIYIDLPGFGETPALPEPGGLPEFAAWLRAFARNEFRLDSDEPRPFAILANSLGGGLGRDLMAEFPGAVLGALLLAPVVDPRPSHRDRPAFQIVERDEEFTRTLDPEEAEDYFQMSVVQTPATWERFRAAALPGIQAADHDAMHRLQHGYVLPDVPEDRGALPTTPVTILAGRQDQVVGFRDQFELAQRYARGSYVMVDGAGHNVHLDQPGLVERVVDAWKDKLEAGTGEVPAR